MPVTSLNLIPISSEKIRVSRKTMSRGPRNAQSNPRYEPW